LQIKGAKKAMDKNGVTPEDRDSAGMPALHVAMQNGQLKFAEWLLTRPRPTLTAPRIKICTLRFTS
jgi:ankyrin repeat protein